MKTLLLIVVAFVFPVLVHAEDSFENLRSGEERRKLICDQLSDSQCFGREVNSICIFDAQKGQAGFCRPHAKTYDQETVTCWCF